MIDPNDEQSPKCRQCGDPVQTPGELCRMCQMIERDNKTALDQLKVVNEMFEKIFNIPCKR